MRQEKHGCLKSLDSISISSCALMACMKQWEYRNIIRTPALTNPFAALSIVIHRMTNLFFQKRKTKKGFIKIGFANQKAFVNTGNFFWQGVAGGKYGPYAFESAPKPVLWESVKQKKDLTSALFGTLNRFWSENLVYRDSDSFFPRCGVTFKKVNIPSAEFGTHAIYGKVDRVQPVPDDEGEEIWDYRLSIRIPSADMLKEDLRILMGHALYSLACEKSPLQMRVYPFRHGIEHMVDAPLDQGRRPDERIADLSSRLDEFQKAVLSATELGRFKKNPTPRCFFCEYRSTCWSDHTNETKEERRAIEQLQDTEYQFSAEQLANKGKMP